MKFIAALTSLKARLVSNDPYEISCGSRETKTRVHHLIISYIFFSFEARACQVYEDGKRKQADPCSHFGRSAPHITQIKNGKCIG